MTYVVGKFLFFYITLYSIKFRFQCGRMTAMIFWAPPITSFSSICTGTKGTFELEVEGCVIHDDCLPLLGHILSIRAIELSDTLGARVIPDAVFSEYELTLVSVPMLLFGSIYKSKTKYIP